MTSSSAVKTSVVVPLQGNLRGAIGRRSRQAAAKIVFTFVFVELTPPPPLPEVLKSSAWLSGTISIGGGERPPKADILAVGLSARTTGDGGGRVGRTGR